MTEQRVEISRHTIVFTVVFLISLFILHQIREIIILFFVAFIFASALNPTITRMEHRRIPRTIALFIVYIIVLSVIGVGIALVVPPLVRQSITLLTQVHIPQFLPQGLNMAEIQNGLQNYDNLLSKIGGSIPTVLNGIITTFFNVLIIFTILVLTFYLTLEKNRLPKHIAWLFSGAHAEERSKKFMDRLETQLGGWVRGEATLMLIIGILTFIGLSLLGIPFALPLAILAGSLEAVPNIGPTISTIPGVAIAFFTISPAMGLVTLLLYVLIQQLENNIIVPKVMSAAVGIHPLMTILALLSGLKLGGIIGMLLAVPSFIVLRTVFDLYFDGKNPLKTDSPGL